jgi:ribonuclease P protein component
MTEAAGSCAFPRTKRLLHPSAFRETLTKADIRLSSGPLRLMARANGLGRARLGLIVARRIQHRAVDRNLTKRAIRETFRQTDNLPAVDIVVQLRSKPQRPVSIEMKKLLAKLRNRSGTPGETHEKNGSL